MKVSRAFCFMVVGCLCFALTFSACKRKQRHYAGMDNTNAAGPVDPHSNNK